MSLREPYHARDGREPAAIAAGVEDDSEYFEVETILMWRTTKAGESQYLVRWKGWGPAHDQWCSEDDLEGAQLLLKEFHARDGPQATRSGRLPKKQMRTK